MELNEIGDLSNGKINGVSNLKSQNTCTVSSHYNGHLCFWAFCHFNDLLILFNINRQHIIYRIFFNKFVNNESVGSEIIPKNQIKCTILDGTSLKYTKHQIYLPRKSRESILRLKMNLLKCSISRIAGQIKWAGKTWWAQI